MLGSHSRYFYDIILNFLSRLADLISALTSLLALSQKKFLSYRIRIVFLNWDIWRNELFIWEYFVDSHFILHCLRVFELVYADKRIKFFIKLFTSRFLTLITLTPGQFFLGLLWKPHRGYSDLSLWKKRSIQTSRFNFVNWRSKLGVLRVSSRILRAVLGMVTRS